MALNLIYNLLYTSPTRRALDTFNVVLNLIFLTECLLKIVADSFWGYLKRSFPPLVV